MKEVGVQTPTAACASGADSGPRGGRELRHVREQLAGARDGAGGRGAGCKRLQGEV